VTCAGSERISRLSDRYSDRIEAQIAGFLGKHDIKQAENIIMETAGLRRCDSAGWSLFEVTQFTAGLINTIAENDRGGNYRSYEEVQDAINYGLRTLNKEIILDNISLALRIAAGTGTSEGSSISSQVESVHDYITKHYMDHLSLSDLAEQFYVEPSYLSRKFSQTYNETITAFITRCRMNRAKELMQDESNKLEVISFDVGYDDYNYFSRVFRRFEGISPTEYRKNLAAE
jgi:YesN/AraC family two-component response regulator